MRMLKKRKFHTSLFLIHTSLFFILHPSSFILPAYGGVGRDAAQFLKLGSGARAVGMGESFVAVADDANAVLWNPGGLGFLKQKEFAAMHMEYLENIRFSGISYAHPTQLWGTFAGNISYLYTSGIAKTVLANDKPEGFESKGEFGASDKSAFLAYGRVITGDKENEKKSLGLGVGVRYFQESLDQYTGSAFSVDFGALYKLSSRLRFGFALQNLGSRLKFVRESDPLPLVFRFGFGGTEFGKKLNYSAEFFVPRDSGMEFRSGAEYWIWRLVAPRFGWRFRKINRSNGLDTLSGMTAGIGFRFFNYQIDYGFVPFGDAGNTHRISITGRF